MLVKMGRSRKFPPHGGNLQCPEGGGGEKNLLRTSKGGGGNKDIGVKMVMFLEKPDLEEPSL